MGNKMVILHEVDKCVRCNGCVIACKREWDLKNPSSMADITPQRMVVSPRQRLAIKSQRRVDMGPFVRFTCWHCPDPPCAGACPLGAIAKQENGAVSVDNNKCQPNVCYPSKPAGAPYPCEVACQRGGYPKVGVAYESRPGIVKMNKCTLCNGRAGSDAQITAVGGNPLTGLPTRAKKSGADYISAISGLAVPELAHEPACVSSCPAKAYRWDTEANIVTYLNANYVDAATGTKLWTGDGAIKWASKRQRFTPPKADPFIEDHVAPMASSLFTSGKMVLPTLVIGGLAAISMRRTKNEELDAMTGEEA